MRGFPVLAEILPVVVATVLAETGGVRSRFVPGVVRPPLSDVNPN
jgi:hypothetical protein